MLMRFTLLFVTLLFSGQITFAAPKVVASQPCSLLEDLFTNSRNREAIFYERVTAPLENILPILRSSKSAKEAAIALTSQDYRASIFKVEALMRFYGEEKWAKNFTRYRPQLKGFEDYLGWAKDAQELPVTVEKYKLKIPTETVQYLKDDAVAKMNDFSKFLDEGHWIGEGNTMDRLLSDLKKVKVPSQTETAAYVLDKLAEEAKAIRKKKLDMNTLEGSEGIHELRRRLRWILIEVNAHRGQIEIVQDAKIPKAIEPFTHVGEESKKYLEYPKTELKLKQTVPFKESNYLALTYFVERLGDIKDSGELHNKVLEALVKSKAYASEKAANDWLTPYLKSKIEWKDYATEAKKAYEDLIKSKLLESIP